MLRIVKRCMGDGCWQLSYMCPDLQCHLAFKLVYSAMLKNAPQKLEFKF